MNGLAGPVAGRMKRPGWRDPRLLIGMALIAMGVGATATIVADADRTTPVYAARGVLVPGTVLSEENVVVAHVRVGGGTYVTPADEPFGLVVTRVIGDGELLPTSAVAEPEAVAERPVAIVTTHPLAEGIDRGSVVDVWLTASDVDEPTSVRVAEGLVVADVERASGSFANSAAETVYVLVPADEVGELLAALAINGDVAVVGLEPGGSE